MGDSQEETRASEGGLNRRYEGPLREIAPTGYRSLEKVKDRKIRREIAAAIDGLATQPEAQGKALLRPLQGLRSLRAARSRYRIVYRVDLEALRVSVLLVAERLPGREEDVYKVARRLLDTLLGDE